MNEITSVTNELVKDTAKLQQKKFRNSENKFLLEGYKVVKEAFDFGIEIENLFVLKEHENRYKFLKDKIILTNEAVLKKISTTETSPEVVAVGIQKHFDKSILKNTKKVVLLENIKDTGNLGTILRTSVAFGADAVILYGKETVDLYNPKCVRSAVGNLWKIPVISIETFGELERYFNDYKKIATLPKATTNLKDFTSKMPMIIMFGSEADGLSKELIKFATDSVKIEMNKNVESLNLSISTAVVLYELFIEHNS